MFCSKCGTEVANEACFCSNCGAQINSQSEEGRIHNASDNCDRSEMMVPRTQAPQNNVMMSKTATSVVAYMTWIGFLISICIGDKENSKFFLNQALVFHLFRLACIIPVLGWLWAIYMLICFIFGVIWAAQQEENELPLIGTIRVLK